MMFIMVVSYTIINHTVEIRHSTTQAVGLVKTWFLVMLVIILLIITIMDIHTALIMMRLTVSHTIKEILMLALIIM